MGLIETKKLEKKNNIIQAAFDLFINQGIEKTSIGDITKKARVAKGTFYLYFESKYELNNILIHNEATKLFIESKEALEEKEPEGFKAQVIFIVDFMLDKFTKEPWILEFISKNLSWGILQKAIKENDEHDTRIQEYIQGLILNSEYIFEDYEVMVYTIIELINSTSHSVILHNNPVNIDVLKKYLHKDINSIIDNHIISLKEEIDE